MCIPRSPLHYYNLKNTLLTDLIEKESSEQKVQVFRYLVHIRFLLVSSQFHHFCWHVRFEMAAFVGSRQFPSVTCHNKKDGRMEACDLALRQLVAEGQFQGQGGATGAVKVGH